MTFSISTILEVGLGLALIYYVLGLIVSYITAEIIKWTEMQAKDLEVGLRDLLGDSEKLEDFVKHPWIKNLEPKRLKFLQGFLKTYKTDSVPIETYKTYRVDHIPASTFAMTLFDVLASSAKDKEGDNSDDPKPKSQDDLLKEIKEGIMALPEESGARKMLLGLIDSGVTEVQEARQLVETWFDDTMNNVSLLYKQHARRIAVIIALVVTLVTGADSIAIATSLWKEPSLRAGIAARVDKIIEEEGTKGDVQKYVSELEELRIPILWGPDTWPKDAAGWASKALGLLITWVAAAQGSSFWYQTLKRIRSAVTAPTITSSAET